MVVRMSSEFAPIRGSEVGLRGLVTCRHLGSVGTSLSVVLAKVSWREASWVVVFFRRPRARCRVREQDVWLREAGAKMLASRTP